MKLPKKQAGFTLIELLVALTIITVLSVSVFVALDPAKRLQESKDARRSSDVQSILTAVHQSIVDAKGSMPTNLSSLTVGTEAMLGTDASGCNVSNTYCGTQAACVDLMTGAQNVSKYLKNVPVDPVGTASAAKTGYAVVKDSNNIITVKACYADTATISASR